MKVREASAGSGVLLLLPLLLEAAPCKALAESSSPSWLTGVGDINLIQIAKKPGTGPRNI